MLNIEQVVLAVTPTPSSIDHDHVIMVRNPKFVVLPSEQGKPLEIVLKIVGSSISILRKK